MTATKPKPASEMTAYCECGDRFHQSGEDLEAILAAYREWFAAHQHEDEK